MIRIFNSLSQQLQPLQPREGNRVGIYVCGMTVYDYCHLGHARALIVFDVVVRYLRARGYDVRYVRNFTDIDDKIIQRARENGESVPELTARFIAAMREDAIHLGLLSPDVEPRATAYIGEIIAMTGALIENGYAYQGGNGDVYFSVRSFPAYGQLSGQSIDELRSGARIAPDESKRDPLDFVLWKAAKPDEPQWPSPWGPGRPGWHIECSAMSTACLGEHFEIHGGGVDLKFPHHECEIAQSEGASGGPFVDIWMHNGHVRVDEEKMSKSLGNFFTIREILGRDPNPRRMGEIIRVMVLGSHYRSPLNYSLETLDGASAALTRIYMALDSVGALPHAGSDGADEPMNYRARFEDAMNADFNTPVALSVLFDLVRDINRALDAGERGRAGRLGAELRDLASVLGLLALSTEEFLRDANVPKTEAGGRSGDVARDGDDVQSLIAERARARQSGDWARADALRRDLERLGVVIEDLPDGKTRWRRQQGM